MVGQLFAKNSNRPGLAAAGSTPRTRQYLLNELVRLFVLPLFFGLLLGWNKAGLGVQLSMPVAIAYWCGICLFVWLAAHAFTRLVSRIKWVSARRVSIQLLLGMMLSYLVVGFVLVWYVAFFRDGHLLGLTETWDRYAGFSFLSRLRQSSVTVVVWILANIGWMAIRRYSPYGIFAGPAGFSADIGAADGGTGEGRPAPEQPPRMLRVGSQEFPLANIVAVKAEDHYVRVFQVDGSKPLIHGRFSDISTQVKDVSSAIRVHRSYWVNLNHVSSVRLNGRILSLEMSNGMTIPVSESHRALLEAAIENGAPGVQVLSKPAAASPGEPL